jgi:hypothetical protein
MHRSMRQVGYFWKRAGGIVSAMVFWPRAAVILAVVGGAHLIGMGGIGDGFVEVDDRIEVA